MFRDILGGDTVNDLSGTTIPHPLSSSEGGQHLQMMHHGHFVYGESEIVGGQLHPHHMVQQPLHSPYGYTGGLRGPLTESPIPPVQELPNESYNSESE